MRRAEEQTISIKITARGPDGQVVPTPKTQPQPSTKVSQNVPNVVAAASSHAKSNSSKLPLPGDTKIKVTLSHSNSPLAGSGVAAPGDVTPLKVHRDADATLATGKLASASATRTNITLPPASASSVVSKASSSGANRAKPSSGAPSSSSANYGSYAPESGYYLDLPGGVRSAPGYSQNHVLPQLAQFIPPYYEYMRPSLTETPAGVVPLAACDDQWGPLESITLAPSVGGSMIAQKPQPASGAVAMGMGNAHPAPVGVSNSQNNDLISSPPHEDFHLHDPHAVEMATYYPMLLSTPTITTETAHMTTNLYFPLPPPATLTRGQENHATAPISAFFVNENLRSELSRRQAANLTVPFNHDVPIPESMFCYHSFVPLEGLPALPSHALLGYKSLWYRCISQRDGRTYALLRILDFRLPHESMLSSVVDLWSGIQHPGVVRLHEAFTTSAFGAEMSSSLVLVLDFYPASRTLAEVAASRPLRPDNPEHVRLVMSMLMQLASAMKAVHRAGMAIGANIDETKILFTSSNRFRFNACGAQEFVGLSSNSTAASRLHHEATPEQLQSDFDRLGKVFSRITAHSGPLSSIKNPTSATVNSSLATSMSNIKIGVPPGLSSKLSPPSGGISISRKIISRGWPESLQKAIAYLNDSSQHRTVEDLICICSEIALAEMDLLHCETDALEDELCRSLENGRIARLLMKINFVTDRPEHAMDPRWAQTGDRYFVRLFKEYIFHTVDQGGNPVIDVGHVITCLNKLDAGVSERIPLTSSDGRNVLIIGYDELRRCIEDSFHELVS